MTNDRVGVLAALDVPAAVVGAGGRFEAVDESLAALLGAGPGALVGTDAASALGPLPEPGDRRATAIGDRAAPRQIAVGELGGGQRLVTVGSSAGSGDLTALRAFSDDLVDRRSVAGAARRTIAAAETVLDPDECTLLLADGDQIVPVAASDGSGGETVAAADIDDGPAGRALRTGESVRVDDSGELPDDGPIPDETRAAIVVPIADRGVLRATAADLDAFDDRDVELAELLGTRLRATLDRIENRRELTAERDLLAALFEDMPQPAVRVEDDDGEIVAWGANDAFEEMFGYAAEEIVGENIYDYVLPPDGEEVSIDGAVKGDQPTRQRVARETVDGPREFFLHVIPVDTAGGADIAYGIYTDIEDQRRVARALERLHEATREMVRADDAEAIAAMAVETAGEAIGVPQVGCRLRDDDGALSLVAVSESLREGDVSFPPVTPGEGVVGGAYADGELQVIDDVAIDPGVTWPPAGSLIAAPLGDHGVLLLSSPRTAAFDDSDVSLIRVLAANAEVALDRAERVELLREREAALSRQNRRLERFASVVSHDLRNPISVADGYLTLARDHLAAGDLDAAADALDRIASALDRMETIVDDLLSLTREGDDIDAVDSVSVGEVAVDAWSTVDTPETASLRLRDPPAIPADPGSLRTALENLLRNAVEHGSTSPRSDPPEDAVRETESVTVTVGSLPDDGPEGFYVADDGPGFARDDPQELFEYGVSEGATGLGLAIVREVAEAHGWRVRPTEAADGGARFEFYLSGDRSPGSDG